MEVRAPLELFIAHEGREEEPSLDAGVGEEMVDNEVGMKRKEGLASEQEEEELEEDVITGEVEVVVEVEGVEAASLNLSQGTDSSVTEEAPSCWVCKLTFKTTTEHEKHKGSYHELPKLRRVIVTDECDVCGTFFYNKTTWVEHMLSEHETPFERWEEMHCSETVDIENTKCFHCGELLAQYLDDEENCIIAREHFWK